MLDDADLTCRKSMASVIYKSVDDFIEMMEKQGMPEPNMDGVKKTMIEGKMGDKSGLTCDVTMYEPTDSKTRDPLPGLAYVRGGGMAMFTGKEKGFDMECIEL